MKGPDGERSLMDYFEDRVLTEEDLRQLLEDYYEECGWDNATGIPARQKLVELGLEMALPVLEVNNA